MEFALETPLPTSIEVGQGSALFLKGWCYHPDRTLRQLHVLVDDQAYVVRRHSFTRFDILREREPDLDGKGNALNSGFSAVVPLPTVSSERPVTISLRASFSGGLTETAEFGRLLTRPFASENSSVAGEEVAIVLVVDALDEDALNAQLDSIIAQSHRAWRCLISVNDGLALDPLIKRYVSETRIHWRTHSSEDSPLEDLLSSLQTNAGFITIAGAGDIWSPERLSDSLFAFDGNTSAVFSRWESSEEDRHASENKTGSTRLETALFGQLIPAGAIVFRRSLLSGMLPFPPSMPHTSSEDWVSISAIALGNAKFIDKALYKPLDAPADIVFDPTSFLAGGKGTAAWMDELMVERSDPDSQIARWASNVWIPERSVFWSEILAHRNPPADKRVILERWRRAFDFPRALLGDTRGEGGHAWTTYYAFGSENRLSTFTKRHRKEVLRNLRTIWGLGQRDRAGFVNQGVDAARMHIDFIPKKIAPLNLEVSESHPRRINIVTSTIDFKYLFGGYFAVFSLALALDKAGYKVRLILTDPVDYKPNFWKHEIKKYHGLGDFFDRVEVKPNYERDPVESSPQDRFIATSWWTAFAAHSGAERLGTDRFIYLSQDFEPFFYAASSFYALSLQSYSLPHYAMFSTEFLREYSRAHGYGVFTEGRELGDNNSISFQNAIKAPTPRREKLERHGRKKRVLVYARPEDHANRNCFQLAALGLIGAIEEGHFPTEEWEFHGIGTVKVNGVMRLSGRADLRFLPKVSLEEYYSLLSGYEVGLSLMLTPHPSLVPLDMAASGIVTVTNTFDIKTKERLEAISSNLVVVPPTIDGIRQGLIDAKSKVDDVDARMKGTKLNWARTWDQAFNQEFMTKLKSWIEAGK